MKVSRFVPGQEQAQSEVCEGKLDQLIRAIANVGGGYAEILEAVQSTKRSGDLSIRVVIDNQAISRRKAESPGEDESEAIDATLEQLVDSEASLEVLDSRLDPDDQQTVEEKIPATGGGSEPDFDVLPKGLFDTMPAQSVSEE